MNEEQEEVWDRLKHGVTTTPEFYGLDPEKVARAFMRAARTMGKSTMAMQAVGRAMRELKDEK